MENSKEVLPRIRVSVPMLCKELNRLTGGESTKFTGYYCSIYPAWHMHQVYNKDAVSNGERDPEKLLRNCELKYTLLIHRSCIVPEKYDQPDYTYPVFSFDNISIKLKDKLADGSRVFNHVVVNDDRKLCTTMQTFGAESMGNNGERFLALNKRINPCLLNVDLSIEMVEKQTTKEAKTTLAQAIASLSRTKSSDGGKV